jgi:hypothetical protein
VNGDVSPVEEAGERDCDASNGENVGGRAARELEMAVWEKSGESEAVGEEAEPGKGEAARDDVEAEGVSVR